MLLNQSDNAKTNEDCNFNYGIIIRSNCSRGACSYSVDSISIDMAANFVSDQPTPEVAES